MAGERTLPGIGLTGFWNSGDNTWKTGMDANLRILSAVVQARALSMTTPFPFDDSNSTAFVDGDVYIVPASDSNSLQDSNSSPHHGYLAIHDNGDWVYLAPSIGWIAYVVDLVQHYRYTSGGWVPHTDAFYLSYSSADTGDSNSTESTVGDALDDLYERVRNVAGGAISASTVTYDSGTGGDSNSTEANVADALDDLYERGRTGSYDIGMFVAGLSTNAELVAKFMCVRAFRLPTSLTGSYADAEAASTGNVSFTIKKNGASIGTVDFATDDTGTFTFAAPIDFAPGDILTLTAPGTADATLADVSFTFAGARI